MKEESTDQVYDYRFLAQITNGDKEFERKLLYIFVSTVPNATSELMKSLESSDFISLAETAHKMKTTIHSMGIKQLKGPISKLEELATKKANTKEIEKLTNEVVGFMDALTSEFKSRLLY